MRILISAYACEPGRGSEPGVGWNVVKHLSTHGDLWVVTRANNRECIQSCDEPWVKQVRWIFWDPPKSLTFWKKGGRGVQAFYILWQWLVFGLCRNIVREQKIDVAHHLTFGKYWIPSRLAALPIPFIFGPVGGGEETPPLLHHCEGFRGRWATGTKKLLEVLITRNPLSLDLYHRASWTFAATDQTASKLRSLGVERISILPQSGISPQDLPSIGPQPHGEDHPCGELRLVTAARLIHWKAIDLAIEAVAEAHKKIPVRLIVLQNGPELKNLQDLARRLGIEDRVEFKGRLPSLEAVYREIASADALVHPALHEAFGQACLESLALGVPVICLNWGGPGLIVDKETGFAVEPGSRKETISRLAQDMINLGVERQQGVSRTTACKNRAFSQFHWAKLADAIVNKYHEAAPVGRIPPGPP